MAQSLAKMILHIVFSTKDRLPFVHPDIEQDLYSYICGISNNLQCPVFKIGGMPDHLHLCCLLSRTITVRDLMEKIKANSSAWIKTKGVQYRKFAWQHGYGAFSIGQSQLLTLERYIDNQKEHHRKKGYQEELRGLLRKYQIDYDENYLWD